MIDISVDQQSIHDVQVLRRKHQLANAALAVGTNSPVDEMLHSIVFQVGKRWEELAPKDTTTLSLATRETVENGIGQVFTDPEIQNPVSGGYPAEYGVFVHADQPWIEAVFVVYVPRILTDEVTVFYDALDRIYQP